MLPTHTIDGKLFDDEIKQMMVLNSVEEWTVVNKAVGIAHPFHIHINPFQVVEVFDPNSAEATDHEDPDPCYADPTNPETWDRDHCDTLAASGAVRLVGRPGNTCGPRRGVCSSRGCSVFRTNLLKVNIGALVLEVMLVRPKDNVQCSVTVEIPGYFKMRSRFVDFPGVFVQHCHILAHEDVGMMQLVEVYDRKVGPTKGTMRTQALLADHKRVTRTG